jgi:ribosome maturation factor RimP
MSKLSSPKLLTKSLHEQILLSLRSTLEEMKKAEESDFEIKKIRIRNLLFLYEEGVPTVDIIIDKGYSEADVTHNVVPRFANSSLTFDECTKVQKFLLSTDVLDAFSDQVDIRVGSPGSEPTLYDYEDYQASIGNMVKVETWDPMEERSKFTMILVDIFIKEGNSMAVLAEGGHRFEIPLNNIKNAFVLLFHPASISMKQSKNSAKNKSRKK